MNRSDKVFSHQGQEISEMERASQNDAMAAKEFDPRTPLVFLSANPTVQRAQELARRVARSNMTVLIRGEIGTGKCTLARAIHAWSGHVNSPFSVIACGSFVGKDSSEHELLRHLGDSADSFAADHCKNDASDNGGTLFLDEVGQLPPAIQSTLVRFLQDGAWGYSGHRMMTQVMPRLIASTSIDLRDAIASGTLLQDLFDHLSVVQIDLPPLQQRREDIVTAAVDLLAEFAKQLRKPGLRFSEEAFDTIQGYAWPGNFLELGNVIERASSVCRDGPIGPEHLLLDWSPTPQPRLGDLVPIAQIEELHIRRVLAKAPSIEKAAETLKIDTVTLWRRRKKYGIDTQGDPPQIARTRAAQREHNGESVSGNATSNQH